MRIFSTRRHFTALSLCAALAATGCGGLRAARAPLDITLEKSNCTPNADTLIVMLPGAHSRPEEFVREGFVDALNENRLAVDVMRVDAHLGYYNDKTILDRLSRDVMAPARSQGYKAIWIVGISIGGFGALLYAQTHPGELAGLVAIAPYLGERTLGTDIANAGGLARWTGPLGNPPGSNPRAPNETQLWQWLRGYVGATATYGPRPPLYLGYGVDDRFAFNQRLLAAALPADRVFTTEGGHDWPEWTRLWRRMLPTLPLPGCPG
ncbi:alpha/beta hydrolase [Variovorax paradoxus]|uniref:alpha/beta hydrolase n=1 Tax=Variovorax paradoxus TaxID=34073 RepID=UPI00277EE862|nr:alpha/beta hydrolase [Variovorax paradoxus]MDQ0591455.1 S-formylglutathione hydrolase FrmB [Variovorax paradoxus]